MLRSARGLCVLFALTTSGMVVNTAHADLIDPNEAACGAAGTACEVDGKAGICEAATCTKLVYGGGGGGVKTPDGEPLPDSRGYGPRTKSYDCTRCKIGAAPPEGEEPNADTKTADATPADAKAADAKTADAKTADAKTTDAKAADAKTADAKTADAKAEAPKAADSKPEAKSGCSVSNSTTSLTSFGLGLALLGFVARRRKR